MLHLQQIVLNIKNVDIYKSGSKKGTMCSCNGFDCNGTSLHETLEAAEKRKQRNLQIISQKRNIQKRI